MTPNCLQITDGPHLKPVEYGAAIDAIKKQSARIWIDIQDADSSDLEKMLDENEFFGPHGIHSISRFHEKHPYALQVDGQDYQVDYLPAESNTGMFGGNSNWRGPVWMPVNIMIVRALQQYYLYYGDNFKIECPTGLGASHQTGWSGVVAKLIQLYGSMDPEKLLEVGKKAAFINSEQIEERGK